MVSNWQHTVCPLSFFSVNVPHRLSSSSMTLSLYSSSFIRGLTMLLNFLAYNIIAPLKLSNPFLVFLQPIQKDSQTQFSRHRGNLWALATHRNLLSQARGTVWHPAPVLRQLTAWPLYGKSFWVEVVYPLPPWWRGFRELEPCLSIHWSSVCSRYGVRNTAIHIQHSRGMLRYTSLWEGFIETSPGTLACWGLAYEAAGGHLPEGLRVMWLTNSL